MRCTFRWVAFFSVSRRLALPCLDVRRMTTGPDIHATFRVGHATAVGDVVNSSLCVLQRDLFTLSGGSRGHRIWPPIPPIQLPSGDLLGSWQFDGVVGPWLSSDRLLLYEFYERLVYRFIVTRIIASVNVKLVYLYKRDASVRALLESRLLICQLLI